MNSNSRTPLLDSILTSAPQIVSEQHDTGAIRVEASAVDSALAARSGVWDAAEYGISAEQVQQRLAAANTPEARERVLADLRQRAIRRAGLDTSNGRVNLMVAGELPWHGLGVNVREAVNSSHAIKLAGLDWTAGKIQNTYQFNGLTHLADSWSIIRQDTGAALGTVGSRYAAIQNSEGFSFLDSVLGQYGARYEAAGSLYGGAKVFMLAHMPEQRFTINGGDEIEPFVLFLNCHDGSGAAQCFPTSVRTVCANTVRNATRARKGGINIRHTGKVSDKVRAAQEALNLAVDAFQGFKADAETMYHTRCEFVPYANDVLDAVLDVTAADMVKGADALAAALAVTEAERELKAKTIAKQIEKRREILTDIVERYESERCGIGSIRGTAWSAFNAITEHADHGKTGRRTGTIEERKSKRFESIVAGQADELKQVAYVKAMALAN